MLRFDMAQKIIFQGEKDHINMKNVHKFLIIIKKVSVICLLCDCKVIATENNKDFIDIEL